MNPVERQEQEDATAATDDIATALTATASAPTVTEPPRDPYAALRHRDFRFLITGRFVATMGEQMLGIAIGWEIYLRTHSAFALGLVGLVQVLPVILLALPAGQIADQVNRKYVITGALSLITLSAIGLAVLSFTHGPLALIYVAIFFLGCGDAFYTPASTAFISQVVPEADFVNAATWNSSAWQLAAVLGPALGGFVIALQHGSASLIYVMEAIATLIYLVLMLQIRSHHQPIKANRATGIAALVEGVDFVRRTKVILAAITLDLFAVLLGGATTLLPVYATDVLHVGAVGLGWMRAMPSIGAVLMAFTIAHQPPFKHAGKTLLWAVGGFGAATIVFGISPWLPLSLLALFLMGALDNISVVIRATMVLLRTPDAMRGRVSAVNNVFIGMSNQLGGFESGTTAQIFGPALSVLGGGIGTILVVIAVALIWPEIRNLDTLAETPAA